MSRSATPTAWCDGPTSFGWISIGLHWSAAILVVALLFIGSAIGGPDDTARDQALRLHTSLGLSAYLLLWARVVWRALKGHPAPLPRQDKRSYAIGKPLHYVLIGAIAAMLVTGPLMAWAGDLPLRFWSLELPDLLVADMGMFELLRAGHVAAATVLGWGVLVHVIAVIKHVAIDRDGGFDRMLAPPRPLGRKP